MTYIVMDKTGFYMIIKEKNILFLHTIIKNGVKICKKE